ncbi:MAG: bifunctional folylpolyglutamate synthase/dihydrofolate synthase, partial [Candidatus Kapaibacterium sp.]
MTTEHLLERLFAMHRFGIKPGLERTLRLLAHVDDPHRRMRYIHVAGTNGKGSVCATMASILQEQGLRVGLYTSPHIHRFHERIRFNGESITDEEIVRLFGRIEPFIAETEATFFEVTTVMAFLAFAEREVDVCVLETGMGGRFDATNVITPLVSIITSIDMDHQEYLGTTLEEICYQKAGIIKPGVPVVVGEQRESLRDVIRTEAQVCNARVIIAEDEVRVVSADIDGMLRQHREIFRTRTADRSIVARSPLSGDHQARNLACVIAALDACADILDVTDASVRRGIERIADNTGFGGRIACISTDPLIIADVGHNEACLRQCTETLRRSPYAHTKFAWVFGVMKDKDYAAMIREMAWCCSV